MLRQLARSAPVVAFALLTAPIGAQQSIPGAVTSWTPYLGCWSTSSAGSIGPMVCVVPTSAPGRVEFMTVNGDAVVGRTFVDASGGRVPASRPGCTGWESGRWTADGKRLLMNAEYRCGDSPVQRSDAILAPTHPDAFAYIERNTVARGEVPQHITFMVQLDTTTFPREVRARMPHLRPISADMSALEAVEVLSAASIAEASMALDPAVVEAWLDETGQATPETATLVRTLRVAALGGELPRLNMRANFVTERLWRDDRYVTIDDSRANATADHGIIPVPIGGVWSYWNINGFNPSARLSFPYRWP